MICKKCNQDLKEKYFEHFIDSKGRIHKRAMCCYCRSEYWRNYHKKKPIELRIKKRGLIGIVK